MRTSLRILAAAGIALAATTGAHAQQGDRPAYPAGTPTASAGVGAPGAATAGAAMSDQRSMPAASATHRADRMHGGTWSRLDKGMRDSAARGSDARGNHQGRPIIPGA